MVSVCNIRQKLQELPLFSLFNTYCKHNRLNAKLSEYNQEIPQLHNADHPTAQQQDIRKTMKAKQPALSSSIR